MEGMNMSDTLNDLQVEPVSGLTYRVRPAVSGQGAAPCVVLLHGVGSNETGFIEMARQMDPHLTVVLARGPLAFGPMKFGWFQVNFTQNGPAINPEQAEQARQKLLTFVGQLPGLLEVDAARIWMAGFSQGGIMSASVGLTAPEKLRGFGILSGRILPEVLPQVNPGAALSKVHAFVSHGVQDATLGIHFARHAKQVLSGFELPLHYQESQASHALNSAMVDDFNQWLAPQISS
jgi:phospholipase/carboxylesterase